MFYDTWKCVKLLFYLYKLFYNESDKNIENVKHICNQCGAVGQKLLQFLIMNDGFLSAECKKKFNNVFENCENHSWNYTYKTYLKDFGKSIEEEFEITEASKNPIGSGSIGQVYKLYHKRFNKYLALKIKHPNVDINANIFINNILYIIYIIEFIKKIKFSILIKEFLNNIKIQLDYSKEAENTIKLKTLFIDETHVIIPTIHNYSKNCITMDYYDGVSYKDITDTGIKNRISAELYLFLVSSLVNFDYLHCDLHYGNWKVDLNTNSLIIYDCGIIGYTHDHSVNKKIIISIFSNDYTEIANLLIYDFKNNKNYHKLLALLQQTCSKYTNFSSTDRLANFLKQAFVLDVDINQDILRCIQGLVICVNIISVNADKVGKILNKQNGKSTAVTICFYYNLIKRLHKYKALEKSIESWLEEDPTIQQKFEQWLDDSFGHTDVDVFMDVLLKELKI